MAIFYGPATTDRLVYRIIIRSKPTWPEFPLQKTEVCADGNSWLTIRASYDSVCITILQPYWRSEMHDSEGITTDNSNLNLSDHSENHSKQSYIHGDCIVLRSEGTTTDDYNLILSSNSNNSCG